MCNIEMVWGRCHVILKLRSLSTLIKIQIEHVIFKVETDEMDEDYHVYFYFSIILTLGSIWFDLIFYK